ncbi:uncharacterized protein LOC126367727 isoform X2 [Pectinophora gossypiella]|uniref:uncharacterized protein LOC126367727 isoform X2 n=1 Tax=Pectinophora gossypiella TaxID=13191 RepID=UPI00214E323B|nr:uncharacterized protein LOC126367727 isoform X2 [Pectinophora gossypiella]
MCRRWFHSIRLSPTRARLQPQRRARASHLRTRPRRHCVLYSTFDGADHKCRKGPCAGGGAAGAARAAAGRVQPRAGRRRRRPRRALRCACCRRQMALRGRGRRGGGRGDGCGGRRPLTTRRRRRHRGAYLWLSDLLNDTYLGT